MSLTETALAELENRFADRLVTGEAVRRQHANTLTWIDAQPPDAVVFATSTADVADLVAIAARHRVPLIPFGAGTSLEGHVNAPAGGVSVDMTSMDRVLEVNAADLDCRVEAGVSRRRLQDELRDTGLFFPVDPGTEEATIGGMVSTRASGTTTVRYGTMRENVISLQAVMGTGQIVETGGRSKKSAAGYDLTHLLIGAEGTLGIVTHVTLRLHGRPESVVGAVAAFPSLEAACNATMAAVAMGLGLARIELLDSVSIDALNRHSGLMLTPAPTLFLEFHGTRAATAEQSELFAEIARGEGVTSYESAAKDDARRRLWQARHEALWAVREVWPGRKTLVTDVCVPVSRLAECIGATCDDIEANGLVAPIVGHVGDGNFHAIVLYREDDEAEIARVKAFAERLGERALSMAGTCTGEHGIGQGKKSLLAREKVSALPVMASIKRALDPAGIFNPGKVFDL